MSGKFSLVREAYLFGDQNLAARRLAKLHEVFAASSKTFLKETVKGPVGLAVDLGCGVGHTTEMLRRATGAARCVGMDMSVPFLERALSKYRRCDFVLADVREGLPLVTADAMFARYLLTHLPEPERVVHSWLENLSPGGVLLLEENVSFRSEVSALADYMGTITEVMAGQGQDLFLGGRMKSWQVPAGFRIVLLRETCVEEKASVVAEMFGMNFPSWREKAVGLREEAWLEALAGRLDAVREEGGIAEWTLCQLAIERSC